MPFTTCMFCKRSLEEFCYSIYDSVNQPYLNIIQLFGEVEEHLRKDRCICYECLYVIRWIYFMKQILSEAITEEDVAENDRVIAAFNIFKLKMSQPIFLLEDDSDSDDVEEEISHSNIQWVQSDSENDLTTNTDFTEAYDDNNRNEDRSTELRTVKKTRRRNRTHFTHRKNAGKPKSQSTCNESEYVIVERPRSQPNFRSKSKNKENDYRPQSAVGGFGENNWLPVRRTRSVSRMEEQVELNTEEHANRNLGYFPCTTRICEQRCDTFDEIMRHHVEEHGLNKNDIVLEDYAEQLREYDMDGFKIQSQSYLQKKFKFRCLLTLCKKTYKAIETLTDHKIKEHNLMAKYWCTECFNLPFTSQVDLNHHTFEIHNNIDMNCIYCSLSFKNFRNYQVHMEDHWITMRLHKQNPKVAERLNYKEYPCKYCDRVFLEKNLLKQHNSTHDCEQRKKLHRPARTVIIKKYDTGEDCDRFKKRRTDVCSFRTRMQKGTVGWRRENRFGFKFKVGNHQNLGGKVAQIDSATKVVKPTISLPPRKRREYTQLEINHQPKEPKSLSEFPVSILAASQSNNIRAPLPSQIQVIEEQTPKIAHKIEETEKSLKEDEILAVIENIVAPEVVEETAPCVITKVDEHVKKETNSSGKLIMTISLKSIEKYKSKSEKAKDDKSKSHDKVKKKNKRSKIKKKSKRTLSPEPLDEVVHESQQLSEEIPSVEDNDNIICDLAAADFSQSIENRLSELFEESVPETTCNLVINVESDTNTERDKKSRKKKGKKCLSPMTKDNSLSLITDENDVCRSDTDLVMDLSDPIASTEGSGICSSVKDDITGIMQPDVKESSVQINNQEFTLNRDEINKIIFGDQALQKNDVSQENIQILDNIDNLRTNELVSHLDEAPQTELLIDLEDEGLESQKSVKRSLEASPKAKGRKIRRKPDKILKLILDADGKVKGKKRLHKTKSKASQSIQTKQFDQQMPANLVNAKMKDHLYAKSI